MSLSRRWLLQHSTAFACVSAAGLLASRARGAAGDTAHGGPKRIALTNLHTDEHLDIEFFRDGTYVPAALSAIEVLLRDCRNGERHAIDPQLMSNLVDAAHAVGADPVFRVISGYRSPQTNALLHRRSSGVAYTVCT